MKSILDHAKSYEEKMIAMRRHLHTNPELSGAEFETLDFIAAELTQIGIPFTLVVNGGIIGWIEGKKGDGKTVLLRADMDALPIQESSQNLKGNKNAVSKIDGVSHCCGHDAHTAMLLGAARVLWERCEEFYGKVLLFFERGEEATYNITYLMKYLHDEAIHIDSCYGCHVGNMVNAGQLGIFEGPACAGSFEFDIKIIGQSGHGSRPDLANSPIDCFHAVYSMLSGFRVKYMTPFEPLSFSVGYIHCDSAKNIIAGELSFGGTFRIFNMAVGSDVQQKLRDLIPGLCQSYGCKAEITLSTICPPVVNNKTCVEVAKTSIGPAIGSQHLVTIEPWMGSETFACLSEMWPSVFTVLGIFNEEKGTGAQLHNEHFDIDEEVLSLGVAAYAAYAIGFLNSAVDLEGQGFQGSIKELCDLLKWDDGSVF